MDCPPCPPDKMKNRITLIILAVGLTIQITAIAQKTTASRDQLARDAFDLAEKEYSSTEYHSNSYETALAEYTEAIRLKPNYAEAFNGRGIIYREMWKEEESIADFTKAIRLKPNYAEALVNRAITYNQFDQHYTASSDYDKAIKDCTAAIRLQPDFAVAFYTRGDAYDDLHKSYDVYDDPDFKASASELASAKAEANDAYNKSIRDFTEAIRLKPDFAMAFASRGSVYLHNRKYDKAIDDCTEAIRISPKYGYAYEIRSTAYEQLGKTEESQADYKKSQELQ
jgi:tetratricopeptide (TPR) repeat protein